MKNGSYRSIVGCVSELDRSQVLNRNECAVLDAAAAELSAFHTNSTV
jgi:hypothetical protein